MDFSLRPVSPTPCLFCLLHVSALSFLLHLSGPYYFVLHLLLPFTSHRTAEPSPEMRHDRIPAQCMPFLMPGNLGWMVSRGGFSLKPFCALASTLFFPRGHSDACRAAGFSLTSVFAPALPWAWSASPCLPHVAVALQNADEALPPRKPGSLGQTARSLDPNHAVLLLLTYFLH